MTGTNLQPGSVFAGKYLVESTLGRGGFASVFLATDTKIERQVALKVLRPTDPGTLAPNAKERFFREARYLGQLRGQHIVRLHDYGESDGGELYMVLEYVNGRTLADEVTRGPMEPLRALAIIRQVLEGLREVHTVGLVHRDLKPLNIMLFSHLGEPDQVKILDFGISKLVQGPEARLTRKGGVIGTPSYLSPEQLAGRELTEASDIFTTGLILFQMLTGTLPYEHDLAERDHEMRRIGRPIRALLSPRLATLVDALCTYQVAARIQTATDAIERVDEVVRALEHEETAPTTDRPALDRPAPDQDPTTVPRLAPDRRPSTPRPGAAATPRSDRSANRLGIVAVVSIALVASAMALVLAFQTREDDDQPVRREALTPPTPWIAVDDQPTSTTGALSDTGAQDADLHDVGAKSAAIAKFGSAGCRRTGSMVTGQTSTIRAAGAELLGYIPASFRQEEPSPLVVLFHEGKQTPAAVLDALDLIDLAEREGIMIIAPHADRMAFAAGVGYYPSHWPWTRDKQDAAVRQVDAVLDDFCIDRRRVFAIGIGRGAEAADEITCRIGLFTALATEGLRWDKVERIERCAVVTPHLQITTTLDPERPEAGGIGEDGCGEREVLSLDQHNEEMRKRHACSKTRNVRRMGSGKCVEHSCETPLMTCRFDGGRPWLLDRRRCTPPPAADVDAAELLWPFFEQAAANVEPPADATDP